MCVCIFLALKYMHTYIYVFIYMYMYTHICACVCVYMHVRMFMRHVGTCARMYTEDVAFWCPRVYNVARIGVAEVPRQILPAIFLVL